MTINLNVVPQPIIVRVDFPALDNLVAYLQTRQQAKIDALAAQVQQLTATLQQSGSALGAAEAKNK